MALDLTSVTPDDVATRAFGGVAASGLFELRQPAQMTFQVSGGCNADPPTSIKTLLLPPTGAPIEVSGAEVGAGRSERFAIQCAASLLLAPALYRWRSLILPGSVDGLVAANLNASAVVSPAALETRGIHEAFSLVSGPANRSVFAEGRVTAVLQDGEQLTTQLVVTNMSTGQVFASPTIEVVGPTPQPFGTGVVPYVLAGAQLFKAVLSVNYRGQGSVRCALQQRFDR